MHVDYTSTWVLTHIHPCSQWVNNSIRECIYLWLKNFIPCTCKDGQSINSFKDDTEDFNSLKQSILQQLWRHTQQFKGYFTIQLTRYIKKIHIITITAPLTTAITAQKFNKSAWHLLFFSLQRLKYCSLGSKEATQSSNVITFLPVHAEVLVQFSLRGENKYLSKATLWWNNK